MEQGGAMMEGGEWNSFNGVYVNEEADFMAQLFPTNNTSLATNNVVDEGGPGLACWSNDLNMATGSIYSSSDAANNTNLYCSFPQDSYSGGSCITNYHSNVSHENYYMCDNNNNNNNNAVDFLAVNHNNAMLVEFREEKVNPEMEESGEVEHGDDKHLFLKRESELDDKDSEFAGVSRKRGRAADVPKGKRNANKSKKRQKSGSLDEDNNVALNRQSSSGCSSEDESNLSLELNMKSKTRASRGSATDPQSLYARKRRERINERLRILQSLVPNGTKVDISTMLEEAVQYVKFLQLQIKLLSSDDLWMYAPIAYNGMDIGLDIKINAAK